MIFDSHAHLISDDDTRYPPAPLSGALRKGDLDERFTAERILCLMDEAGVERVCAVQRGHVYGYDNRYVIDAAKRYPDRMLAVVAVNAVAPTVAEDVRRWADQGAVGIRFAALNPQVTDTDWFASAPAFAAWNAADAAGVSVCLHIFRPIRLQVLDALSTLADRFPSVKIVVDHVSNAALEAGAPDHGVDEALIAICAKPNVFFKITTINFRRTIEAERPTDAMLAHLVATLGADKIMWGSDIAQTKGAYPDMAEMLRQASVSLSKTNRDKVFNGSWQTVYGTSAKAGA